VAFNLGDIFVTLKAKTEDLRNGLNDVRSFSTGVSNAMESAHGAMIRASEGSRQFLLGLAAVSTAVIGLGAAGVASAGAYEQSRVALETMLGSADKARSLLIEITEFAKSTPFELPEVVTATKQLLAFGVAQKDLIPTLRRLGDIAAGVGVPVGQLSYVYGQVRLAGKLMAQDLMQFTNAGVPLLDYLSQTMGKTAAEIKKSMDVGMGPTFEDVQKAIEAMTNEGGKFGGMMEKQSHTLNGVFSNIKDGFGQTLRAMVGITAAGDIVKGGLFDKVKQGAEEMMPIVMNLPNTLKNAFEASKPYIVPFIGLIIGGVVPALYAWAGAQLAVMAPLIPFLAAGAALAVVVQALVNHFGGWRDVMHELYLAFKLFTGAFQEGDVTSRGFHGAIERLGVAFKKLWDIVGPIAAVIRDQLLSAFRQLWNTFATQLLPALGRLIPLLKPLGILLGAIAAISFVAMVTSLWLFIKALEYGIKVFSWFIQVGANVADKLIGFFVTVGNVIQGVFGWISDNWKLLVGIMLGPIGLVAWTIMRYFDDIKDFITGAMNAIAGIIAGVWNFIYANIISPVFRLWKFEFDVIVNVVSYVLAVIRGLFQVAWWALYNEVISPVIGAIVAAWNGFVGIMSAIWSAVTSAAAGAWNWIWQGAIRPVIDAIVGGIRWMADIIGGIWDWIRGKGQQAGDDVAGRWQGVYNTITGVWSNLTGFFNGLWNGIKSGAGSIADAISGAFTSAFEGAKNTLKASVNWMIDQVNKVIRSVNSSAGKLPGVPDIPQIQKLYTGVNNWRGGLAVVGDRGAELVDLPAGARVHNAQDTAAMLGKGGDNYISLDMNGIMTRSRSELRDVMIDALRAVDEKLVAEGKKPILGSA
jgi:phage-related protein